jgi:hypothetical protein
MLKNTLAALAAAALLAGCAAVQTGSEPAPSPEPSSPIAYLERADVRGCLTREAATELAELLATNKTQADARFAEMAKAHQCTAYVGPLIVQDLTKVGQDLWIIEAGTQEGVLYVPYFQKLRGLST